MVLSKLGSILSTMKIDNAINSDGVPGVGLQAGTPFDPYPASTVWQRTSNVCIERWFL